MPRPQRQSPPLPTHISTAPKLKVLALHLLLAGIVLGAPFAARADSDIATVRQDSFGNAWYNSPPLFTLTGSQNVDAFALAIPKKSGLSASITLSGDGTGFAVQGIAYDTAGTAITITGHGDRVMLTQGAELSAQNGVVLHVAGGAQASSGTLSVDGNSTVNGDVQIDTQGALGVKFTAGSTMNGNIDYAFGTSGSVVFDDSTLNGKVIYDDIGAEDLTLQNGSSIHETGAIDAVDTGNGSTVSISNSTLTADAGHALDVEAGASVNFSDSAASSANSVATVYMNGAAIPLTGDTMVNTGNGAAVYLSEPNQMLAITDSSLVSNVGYALDVEAASGVEFSDSDATSANSTGTLYLKDTGGTLTGDTITNTGAGGAVYLTDPTQTLSITNSHLFTNTAYALDVEAGSNITFSDSSASSANSNGTVYMNGTAIPLSGDTITNTGSGAGVYVADTQNLVLTDTSLINTGTGAGLYAGGDSSLTLDGGSIFAQNGDAIVVGAGDHTLTLDHANVTGGEIAANTGQTDITLQNGTTLNTDISAGSGSVDLTIDSHSVFSGNAQGADEVDLDATGLWNMRGNATVGTLNLGGGTLQIQAQANGFATLQANTLTGGGQIGMNTDIARTQGDTLVIANTNASSGNYTLQIADHSTIAPSDTNAQLQVVQASTTSAPGTGPTFQLAGGETDVGAYKYDLKQESDGWYLYNSDADPVNPINPPINDRTNTVNATLAAQAAAASIWFDELQPLYARMGDLHMAPNSDGVWVRTFGSKERMTPSNSVGVDTTLYMAEVGADHRIPMQNGSWYVGATAGTGNVVESFSNGAGSGTATPTTLGLYATWASNQGWYTDFVLKYDSLSQRFNTTGSGAAITASSHVNGVMASAESGMRFTLPRAWFVEPQIEVAALYQGGSQYTTSYGTPVTTSGSTATAARLSMMVGRDVRFQLSSSSPSVQLEPYADLSLIRQFSANTSETVAGTDFSSNVSENRAQLALGISMQPVHNWQGFVELAYGKGQHYEQPWGFDVGLKKIW